MGSFLKAIKKQCYASVTKLYPKERTYKFKNEWDYKIPDNVVMCVAFSACKRDCSVT
jgi:hypothetical protein